MTNKIWFITIFAMYLIVLPAEADEKKYVVEETINYDLDSNGSQESIERVFVGDDVDGVPDTWLVRVRSNSKAYTSDAITRTESINYAGAKIEIIKISDKEKPMIALWYTAGAYSQGLELFRFDNGLKLIGSIGCDGLVFDDAPIKFVDMDKDGVLEITTISRDWDKNSTKDKITDIYKYSGQTYVHK